MFISGTLDADASHLRSVRLLRAMRLIKLVRMLRASRLITKWENRSAVSSSSVASSARPGAVFLCLTRRARLRDCAHGKDEGIQ